MVLFLFGLLVATLSVATCSAGVDLVSLTAGYGEPVPATRDAALRFLERATTSIRSVPASRRLRITVSEAEATSVLSLGLAVPELARAMETLPPEEVRRIDDIGELRNLLREREAAARASLPFRRRIAAAFDPRVRTGDVQVRFTANGEIVLAAYVQAWRWQQPALVVFAPRAHSGELELAFVEGRLGRVRAPAWAFNQLGRLTAALILLGRDYGEISDLTVERGRLTFVASITG